MAPAVGSLVAYALDITGIDPVKNNLLFERFLNLERYTMPDIDIDIPDVYRPKFIQYVKNRYRSPSCGSNCDLLNFWSQTSYSRCFKRFGTPEYELTNLTKRIGLRDTLASAYERM